jgi:hypothetical protein
MFLISVPALCKEQKTKVTAVDVRRRERERQRASRNNSSNFLCHFHCLLPLTSALW